MKEDAVSVIDRGPRRRAKRHRHRRRRVSLGRSNFFCRRFSWARLYNLELWTWTFFSEIIFFSIYIQLILGSGIE